MGRPAGAKEVKLTEEDLHAVVEEIDGEAFKRVWSQRGAQDASTLLGKASDKNTTVTRIYLEEMEWLLMPLIKASPVHIIHVDSLDKLLAAVFEKHGARNASPFQAALAWDLKTLLQTLGC